MEKLIEHILFVANVNKRNITQLQLQKIAYFILGYLIRNDHEELAKELYKTERFEAWTYGPVLPTIYEKYKKYHNLPILEKGENQERFSSVTELNQVIDNLIQKDVFELVKLSHNQFFWKSNKKRIMNNERPIYNFETLKKEFINA